MSNELAGRGRRLLATLIDMALVPCLTLVLIMVTDIMEDAQDYRDNLWVAWIFVLAVVAYLILNGYGLFRRGQTVGKWLLGIAIIDKNTHEPCALWKLICIRALFFPLMFLPFLLVPLIDILLIFRKDRRCLHDLICATKVVQIRT